MTVAVRRGRIGVEFRDAALADLALLDITTDPHTETHSWTTILNLADRFRLTLYDAAYLELAHRRSLPLASLDQELRAAGPRSCRSVAWRRGVTQRQRRRRLTPGLAEA